MNLKKLEIYYRNKVYETNDKKPVKKILANLVYDKQRVEAKF